MTYFPAGGGEEDINQALSSFSTPETKKEEVKITSIFQSILNEVNTLFHASYKQFKSGAKTYLVIQGILKIIFIIIGITQFYFGGVLSATYHINSLFRTIIFIAFFQIVIGCLTAIPRLALYYAVADEFKLKTLKEYLYNARKNLFRYLGIYFCTRLFIDIGVSLFHIFQILKFFPVGFSEIFFSIIVVIFGLIVAIIYFSWYFFSVYVFVNENTGIIESLRRSEHIMQNQTLRFIAHFILVSLSLVVVTIIPIIGPVIAFFVGGPITVIYMNRLYKNFKLLAAEAK